MKPRCTNECAEDFKSLKKQNEELALAAVKISRRDDFRWLIEAPGQRYLATRRLGRDEFFWTEDHNAALAFRSHEQADGLLMAVRAMDRTINGFDRGLFAFEVNLGDAKAVEHGWMDTCHHLPGHDETMSGLQTLTIRKPQ